MGHANPLRWDCSSRGCFNVKKRPKIEVFAECFPRNIQMGDVDGIVEIGGHVLMLEWKEFEPISTGQKIMYQRITQSSQCHVIVVIGNPETMHVEKYACFHNGKMADWVFGTLDDLKERIRRWVQYASQRLGVPSFGHSG